MALPGCRRVWGCGCCGREDPTRYGGQAQRGQRADALGPKPGGHVLQPGEKLRARRRDREHDADAAHKAAPINQNPRALEKTDSLGVSTANRGKAS